ncbi:MAG: DUF2851 family protein [Bacteroidia bacterium]
MNEQLLQHIWLNKYLLQHNLQTVSGEKIEILNPGTLNTNQGPDFFNAKIKIGNTLWVGNIEIHVKSSSWFEHNHHIDEAYNNVILHVVYVNNKTALNTQNQTIETLELRSYLSQQLLDKYEILIQKQGKIPCENIIQLPESIKLAAWLNRLAIERLERKSKDVFNLLERSNNNWEETFYKMLSKYFGQSVNSEPFLQLAEILPVNILSKHKSNLLQLQSLFLGCAGFINQKQSDIYFIQLQKEFNHLKNKFSLKTLNASIWKFARTRPANFPTVRLLQMALLVYRSNNLFSKICEANTINDMFKLLSVTDNQTFLFSQLVPNSISNKTVSLNTGQSFTESLIINAVVPVVFSFGLYKNNEILKEKACNWLEQIMPEKNAVIKLYNGFGIVAKNASDSQALIELKNNYCNNKKCLSCVIGNRILFN